MEVCAKQWARCVVCRSAFDAVPELRVLVAADVSPTKEDDTPLLLMVIGILYLIGFLRIID